MKCDDYDRESRYDCPPLDRDERRPCNRPVRRRLEPVLVARIFNQPIIEELPYSAMSLTMDHAATISNARSDERPICDDDFYC